MRWIILLLLLINGGYFGWQYYYIPSMDSSEKFIDGGQEYDTLVLLSDLSEDRKEMLGIVNGETEQPSIGARKPNVDKEKKTVSSDKKNISSASSDIKQAARVMNKDAKPASNSTNISNVDSKYCYSIGPIKKKAIVNRISKHIRSMGLDVVKVRKTIKKVPSHWIFLSGYKSEADAKKAISRLASKGIKDTQLIKRSANNIVISVGLFSTKSGADERLKELQDSGFTPQTNMVTANKSSYWLDIKYKDGQAVEDSLLKSLTRGVKGTKAEMSSCK